MRIHLIAVGERMPPWVESGYHEYAKRLPRECALMLTEVAAARRSKNATATQLLRDEGRRLVAAIPPSCRAIALAVEGRPWSTEQLAKALTLWLGDGRDVALLVGGPDGLDREVLTRCEGLWSLSPLTLPHPLVRILVAEQIYRAWTIIHNHPYHRA